MKWCKKNFLLSNGICISNRQECVKENCNQWQPFTHFDRIKIMSVEEMAKEILVVKCLNLLPDPIWCALPLNMFYTNEKEAIEKVKQWLESEVETE